jgi:hypothetical protein
MTAAGKTHLPGALAIRLPTFEASPECRAGTTAGGLSEELVDEDLPQTLRGQANGLALPRLRAPEYCLRARTIWPTRFGGVILRAQTFIIKSAPTGPRQERYA